MVLNIIYAYLENISLISMIICLLLAIFIGFLAIMRYTNDIDRDDWQVLMKWNVPLFIFFLFLTMAPGMEHVKDVNKRFIELSIEPKPLEKPDETIYYPSSNCTSVGLCR